MTYLESRFPERDGRGLLQGRKIFPFGLEPDSCMKPKTIIWTTGFGEQLAKEFDMGTTNIKSAFRRIESAHEAAASPFQLRRKPRRKRRK